VADTDARAEFEALLADMAVEEQQTFLMWAVTWLRDKPAEEVTRLVAEHTAGRCLSAQPAVGMFFTGGKGYDLVERPASPDATVTLHPDGGYEVTIA
jgi:hypothetical protein